jgi:hypothetical protein
MTGGIAEDCEILVDLSNPGRVLTGTKGVAVVKWRRANRTDGPVRPPG